MDNEYDLPVMHAHVAVRLANFIIAFGGMKEACELLSLRVIWMYNVYTEQWRKHVIPDTELAPPTTTNSCAVAVGSDIYMFGGWVIVVGEKGYSNTLWKLTITSTGCIAWSKLIVKGQAKTPSPRSHQSIWENIGKLWTFGGVGTSPDGYLNEHGSFQPGTWYNNQLLCFHIAKQEWKEVKSSGAKPEPRCGHATTTTNNKVWLYGGSCVQNLSIWIFNDLYQLNMHSLVWTKIQTNQNQIKPQGLINHSFCAATDSKLILHGGSRQLPPTWIFDVPLLTWKQKPIDDDYPRFLHTGTECVNGAVIVIGGTKRTIAPYRFIYVKRNVKSLQQLAMKTIFKYKGNLPWRALPKRLITQIMFPGTSENFV